MKAGCHLRPRRIFFRALCKAGRLGISPLGMAFFQRELKL